MQKIIETKKLEGVGPIDNRPSTDKLNHFVRKKKKNYTWHVTRYMWHVKRDMLCRVNILSKFQLPSFYSLWFMIFCRFGGKGWLTDKGVWRTALTTQGLLKTKNLHHCRPKLAIRPFLTSGSGCFAMARTHTQTCRLYDWIRPGGPVSENPTNLSIFVMPISTL